MREETMGGQFRLYLDEGGLELDDLHPSLSGRKVRPQLGGEVAKHVMTRAGITQHGPRDVVRGDYSGADIEYRMPGKDEPLNTMQEGLSAETLRRYSTQGAPAETGWAGGGPYVPAIETFNYENGDTEQWVADGHHRIISNRLGGNRTHEPDDD